MNRKRAQSNDGERRLADLYAIVALR